MPKDQNPTEAPHRILIEDFFGVFVTHAYRKKWVANDTEEKNLKVHRKNPRRNCTSDCTNCEKEAYWGVQAAALDYH